ncbi:hypothetical protein G1H11_15430 [Phytoactinopolyspora alkaliphila]|uniref:Uncharacterized protein n=1 Tax=Phytoactinopolyspora alkaliphila TaxID=1783498 RepID=A0A6N9YNR1_9ACTN|nr:hypothetical protein [Phytoactinopolyspora alkaliphila]NED96701.1 hypothetical protein [Phytoactinopolyspora alkaliphila]
MPKKPVGEYRCLHFSQSLPAGKGQNDLATLLRRVADSVDTLPKRKSLIVLDAVLHTDWNEHGEWLGMTVYYDYAGKRHP